MIVTKYFGDLVVKRGEFHSIQHELENFPLELGEFVSDNFNRWIECREEMEGECLGGGSSVWVGADRECFMFRVDRCTVKLTFKEAPELYVTHRHGIDDGHPTFAGKYSCIEDLQEHLPLSGGIRYMESRLAEGNKFDEPDWEATVEEYLYCIDKDRRHLETITDLFNRWLTDKRPFESVSFMGGGTPIILSASSSVFKIVTCLTQNVYSTSPDDIQNMLYVHEIRTSSDGEERKRERASSEQDEELIGKRVRVGY
jgi:hypothetical protein